MPDGIPMKKTVTVCVFLLNLLISVSSITSHTQASNDLNVEVDGTDTISRGDLAIFYLLTTYRNEGRVDANITSMLIYYRGDLVENLTADVEHIDIGLFWAKYSVASNAPTGTYMILADAKYVLNETELRASTLKGITVSTALTDISARLRSVENDVVSIRADLEAIRPSIDDINAILIDMEESIETAKTNIAALDSSMADLSTSVTEIDGTVNTLQTGVTDLKADTETLKSLIQALQSNVRTVSGALTAVNERVATIERNMSERTSTLTTNLYIVLAISIASAIAAVLAFIAIIELGRIVIGGLKL